MIGTCGKAEIPGNKIDRRVSIAEVATIFWRSPLRTVRRILLFCGCLFAIVSLVAQTPDANKTQARENLDKGIAAFEGSSPQLAADSFVRALELDPDLTNAALYLGVTYDSMVSSETNMNAVANFERAITKDTEYE